MKIISDDDVNKYFTETLTKDSILNIYQPALLNALQDYKRQPEIVPPRTVLPSSTPESDLTHLFMPCVAPYATGLKVISGGSSNSKKGLGFQGFIATVDEMDGRLNGVVNGKTVTPFRTALASTVGLVKAIDPRNVPKTMLTTMTVYGVGPQAYWHIRLALLLYPQIETVAVVNRSLDKSVSFADSLRAEFEKVKTIVAFLYENESHSAQINQHLSESSLVFGCLPSTSPQIEFLSLNEDPQVPVFVSLIGSYKPTMRELDLAALKKSGKKLVVDTAAGVSEEAGEVADAGIESHEMVELSDLVSTNPSEYTMDENIVVQKIVGLSVMDIAVAKMLIECTGITIEGF